MKLRNAIMASIVAATSFISCNNDVPKVNESLTPVSFEKVTLTDNFWLPRLQTQKKTLVPFSLEKTASAVENLRRVAAFTKEGKKEKLIPLALYDSSDLFMVMEGAA